MRIFRFILLFFAFLGFILAAPVGKDEAFKPSVLSASSGFEVKLSIDKSVYLYANKLKLYANGKDINTFLDFPTPSLKDDESVFTSDLSIFIPLGLLYNYSNDELDLIINYQGCSYDGFCYSPLQSSFKINLKNSTITPISINFVLDSIDEAANESTLSNDEQIAALFSDSSAIWVLASFFGYGLLLAFTPCVLPMLPILSAIIVAKASKQKSLKTALSTSIVYVLAMALTNAAFGVIAASIGSGLGAWLQSTPIIVATSVIFALLGILMFIAHNFKMPNALNAFVDKRINASSGYAGVALMGILSALVVSPCVAAPLAGALLYIASSGDVLLGGAALFILGLGMGAPLIALGFGAKILPRPGEWMAKISQIFGFIMLGFALWLLSRVIASEIVILLAGVLCVFAAVILGAFEAASSMVQKAFKAICAVILILGAGFILIFMLKSFNISAPLNTSLNAPLNQNVVTSLKELNNALQSSSKPVIAEFWASWCTNCKVFEKEVLGDKEVQAALNNFTLIKVDVSKADNKSAELLGQFELFGPPALIFYKDGKIQQKITGDVDKNDFLALLAKF